jgi:peptidoglycan/LPS O-acetylase OafA/YrhL
MVTNMRLILSILNISDIKRFTFRQDINILRAVAVLSVVFYHAEIQSFQGGWLGVDIFFVISGYLISNIIISDLNNGNFSFKNFYIRRVRRIIPALFSVILICLPFSYWLLTPRAMLEFTKSMSSSILFYSNYFFQNLDFYNAEPTKVMPLMHTWSLAIEEQFYIFFPLICLFFYKFLRNYFFQLITTIFLFSIFLNSTTSQIVKFYQIQYRVWELLTGVLIMFISSKVKIKNLNYFGYLLIFFSVSYFKDTMLDLNSIEPRILAVFGTGLILLSKTSKFLNTKFLLTIGSSSYSIYLLHQPLFAFYRLFSERYFSFGSLLGGILSIFFVLFVSYYHWKHVEIFFQKLPTILFMKLIITVLIIFLIFILISNFSDGFENRYNFISEEVLFYSNFTNIYPENYDQSKFLYKNRTCNVNLGTDKLCYWHNGKNEKTIYLIGDSLTNSLSVSFLEKLYPAIDNYNLVFIRGRGGRCILSQQSDTVGFVEQCEDSYFEEFLDILNKESDIVIAFGSFHNWLSTQGKEQIKCGNCQHVNVFNNRLTEISKHTSRFVIIQPNPTYNFPIADAYLYKKIKWGEPVTLELALWEERISNFNNFIENLKVKNKVILQTIPIFCDQNIKKVCYASKDNDLYYSDSNHLTLKGANLITTKINQLIFP